MNLTRLLKSSPTTLVFLLICTLVVNAKSTDTDSTKLIVNARVWTGDTDKPWAETIAIKNNRITAVGDAELASRYSELSHPGLSTIDAKGKLVLPGFIDNHTHFMDGSASLVSVKTQTAMSPDEFTETIRDYVGTVQKGEWITGGLWDHEAWGGELPKKHWIDEFTPDNPVFLLRTDGHMAIANSLALELAGINKDSKNPDGGLIVRDRKGEPTGILKDNAMTAVFQALPPPSDEQSSRMFDAGITEGLRNGVTQIHNMSNWDNIAIFEKAKLDNRLKIRTYYFPHISFRHKLAARIKTQGRGDDWLRFGGVKELVDGSLGSTTAWFYAPYTDQKDTSGFPLMKMSELRKSIEEAHNLGLQLAIHGIGDRTNDEILKLFDALGIQDDRARIEHAQHLSDGAIKRFAELGVIASMHPYHAIDDGRWAEKRIGKDRLNGTYAFKSLLDAKAIVSFGSDWSVAPLNPISGIYSAVTRRTLDGKNPDGWVPQQKISVEQAVKAYTVNNAWAGFQENDLGTIEVGKLADIVILSDNIFEIAPEKIIDATVELTMIDGQVMYSSE